MNILNYKTLEEQGYTEYLLRNAPVRVLQFGEGNFLRAFADYFVDVANEKAGFNGKVTLVQPISNGGLEDYFNKQEGLYTLYLRGYENGEAVNIKRVISAIDGYINPYTNFQALLDSAKNPDLRYIVSNTTEAGIVYDGSCAYGDKPPVSFPAKLTRFLHERWKIFGSTKEKGLVVLSCELIDNNGKELAACVQKHLRDWELEPEFMQWLNDECLFCSTLVDRIVTGYPRVEAEKLNKENGYIDNLLDTGEVFGLWVIEGPEWLESELPFSKAGLPVKVVKDHTPYKKQKVRILNGAHTSMVPAAYLCGQNIVRDCMYDEDISAFMKKAVWEEIIPVVPLPLNELEAFAAAVEERFKNPFIDHELLSIALNTTSKWRARVLPSLKEYTVQKGALPSCLAFSLAAYIAFYNCARTENGKMFGVRDGVEYEIQDDSFVIDFFTANSGKDAAELTKLTLSNIQMWGEDLTAIPCLEAQVAETLAAIRQNGMRASMKQVI